MYPALLASRYLTSRLIPVIAIAAVALCVTLVIVVVSVMTGFLDMVKNSGRTLMGDVVISYPVTGIPHYERLIERLEALPETLAATPVIDGWGLLRMPYPSGPHKETETVQFWAVDPEGFSRVTGYADTLHWRPPDEAVGDDDFRRLFKEGTLEGALEAGRRLAFREADGTVTAGVSLGMHVSIGNERQRDGSYRPVLGPQGHWWMPDFEVVLTTLPVDSLASPEPESARLRVVNEFVSGVFLIDDKRIIVPLAVGQRLLHLDEQEIVDDEGETTGIDPPRATMVLVRAVDGVTPDQLRDRVAAVYEAFREALTRDESVPAVVLPAPEGFGVTVQTWLQQQRQFIAPIEKERELMRVLFSLVYIVCAGLVLSIFWAIVYEKTRDIGILRSVGASRFGISTIFLRYGAIIGAIGSVIGLLLAYLIVHNINAIHTAMGGQAPRWLWIGVFVFAGLALAVMIRRCFRGLILPVVLWAILVIVLAGAGLGLMLHRGTLIWDPSVYYFSEIPNTLDTLTALTTVIGAIVFSVLGAFIPAAKAADTDPVQALRYE